VDNASLHKSLDELKQVVDRPEKLKQILATLQSIEARIGERQNPSQPIENKDQAKSRLETILARPEYATGARGPNAFTRLLQDFIRWLQKLFPKRAPMQQGRANTISFIAQILVFGAALFVIVYVIKLLLPRFKRRRKHKAPKKKQPRI